MVAWVWADKNVYDFPELASRKSLVKVSIYKPFMLVKGMKILYLSFPLLLIVACSNQSNVATLAANDFLSSLSPLCDQIYIGQVTSDDPQDVDWRAVDLTLGPIGCSDEGAISMPLAVGGDTSRTWFLTPSEERIEFRHQHLLKDGSVDPVSDYGGYSQDLRFEDGAWLVDFPADTKTVDIFKATGLDVSITNIWSFDYRPKAQLVYELNREGRHFRAEFDLADAE